MEQFDAQKKILTRDDECRDVKNFEQKLRNIPLQLETTQEVRPAKSWRFSPHIMGPPLSPMQALGRLPDGADRI